MNVPTLPACRCTDCPGAGCLCGCNDATPSNVPAGTTCACGAGCGCGCEGSAQGCACSSRAS